MKKHQKKSKFRPSPATAAATTSKYLLSLQLPATSLTPQDRKVLAYLVSCGTSHKTVDTLDNHPVVFECKCFRCYMSFWALWDMSPNRQLIHDIIEVYEEQLLLFEERKRKKRKRKKKKGKRVCDHKEEVNVILIEENSHCCGCHGGQDSEEKGSMKKMITYLGDKIWYLLN